MVSQRQNRQPKWREELSEAETELSTSVPARRSLADVAVSAIAERVTSSISPGSAPELEYLLSFCGTTVAMEGSLRSRVDECRSSPASRDASLVRLADQMDFRPLELLAVSLCVAVDEDARLGRALARIQAPVGGARPTLGLIAEAWSDAADERPRAAREIQVGAAVSSGLLEIIGSDLSLPERSLRVPDFLGLALSGMDGEVGVDGLRIGRNHCESVNLGSEILAETHRRAVALRSLQNAMLIIRSGSKPEAEAVASALARENGMRPLFIEEEITGIVPLALLRNLVPVFCLELGPSDRHSIKGMSEYSGPVVVCCGGDGMVEMEDRSPLTWRLPVPSPEDRFTLWSASLEDRDLSDHLARSYRHGCGRIAQLSRALEGLARLRADGKPSIEDVREAAWTMDGAGLGSLAQPVRDSVSDDALVRSPRLSESLRALLLRCRQRESLTSGLGPSSIARYTPGVRALFVGPSGTGKTLAASWTATQLGMPLFRVDLASVSSKYIGETEKNLSELLAAAEHAEVVLLFDEADSLFGKRTEVQHSNDRFANAQTNYLLQRIEGYAGVVILTSNSMTRFDSAFARRLDFVIDFPSPGPKERRALWKSHLGKEHVLSPKDLNLLAASAVLSGGSIRNAVLAASVMAREDACAIDMSRVCLAVEVEYRKLGLQLPAELAQARGSRPETRGIG